ncbi:MAG: SIS domain-containing protein [Erysipelotrichaceae bacterium]|nr:SIS domain-containing protein [Erysipelotrichaceae bacterium]
MKKLNITYDEMIQSSSLHTVSEIHQQPATWEKTIAQIKREKKQIDEFISKVTLQEDFDIVLTGAGTSEFVGNALFSYLNRVNKYKVKSYGTTDLVASPENYLSATKPTLLVSFARSGNSPESVGAVDVAEAVCSNVYHLFITCNKDGALSKLAAEKENCYAINLADETHDQSFAMTSSFTNMLLAALMCLDVNHFDEHVANMEQMIKNGNRLLNEHFDQIRNVVEVYDFKRIVYLGANTLKGISQESALKMLELTAGKVVTLHDTPLGFRHGPKSIVDEDTLTVVYLSDDTYSYKYELDLIKEMSAQRKGNRLLVIGNRKREEIKSLVDYSYFFAGEDTDNVLLGINYILCGQLIALFKSLDLNLTPDNPCPSGEVNRVVKGVVLYPYQRKMVV